jgi:hypothetical protein
VDSASPLEILGINGNTHYRAFASRIFEGWVGFIQTRFKTYDAITANVIVNTFSGLLLDLLITQNRKCINASFRAFSALLIKGGNL